MSRLVAINIDHIGIMNLDLDISREVFDNLGFACGASTQIDTGIKGEQSPLNLHFILDNTYVECIKSHPGDYLSEYLHSSAALHTVVLSCSEYVKSHQNVLNAGFALVDPMIATRPADHGANKGTASFGWFKVLDNIIPNTLLGVAEHLTRDLIFQPQRYMHPNTAYRINKLIACCENNLAQSATKSLTKLSESLVDSEYNTGIRCLQIMALDEIIEEYCVTPDPKRSHYVGLDIVVKSLDPLMERLERLPYRYHTFSDGIVVDLIEQLNLFIVFGTH